MLFGELILTVVVGVVVLLPRSMSGNSSSADVVCLEDNDSDFGKGCRNSDFPSFCTPAWCRMYEVPTEPRNDDLGGLFFDENAIGTDDLAKYELFISYLI